MRNSSIAFVTLVVVALSFSTLAADDKAEAAKYQGVWRFDSVVNGGKNKAKESSEKMTIKFDEDRFTMRKGTAFAGGGTWKLDTGKKPLEIALVYTEGDYVGTSLTCIYRWNDEDLVICQGDPRPTKFESDSKNKNFLFRFSKIKKRP